MNFSTIIVFALPLLAFSAAFIFSRFSLGASLSALLTVGYFSGVIRGNFMSVFTTFMFDMAVLGVYLGVLFNQPEIVGRIRKLSILSWLIPLVLWPLVVATIPVNDIMIQMLAFRSTVWLLPLMLLGARISEKDLTLVARVLVALNLCALAGGLYCYFYGVTSLYPIRNAVTEIIYKSGDVKGGYLRIPSIFLSSAAYGGTMLASLPFIVNRLFHPQANGTEKLWMLAGLGAACIGIAICASRAPAVAAVIILLMVWFFSGFSARVGIPILIGFTLFVILVLSNERFQRVTSIFEEDTLSRRLGGSVNRNFMELFFDYPFGAGMGSSVGTSIPYFLSNRAPKPIGLENEYSRILIDQGWIGLFLWGMFLFWVHVPWPKLKHVRSNFKFGTLMIYAASITTWCTAVIGSGTLSAVPGSAMLLINMGIIVARREEFAAAAKRIAVRRRPPSPQSRWQPDL